MPASIAEALRTNLLGAIAVTTFTSRISRGRAAEQTAFPYVVLDQVGAMPVEKSSQGRFPREVWQIACYAKDDVTARQIGEAAFAALNETPLSVTGRKILEVAPETEVMVIQDDRKIWQGTFRVGVKSQVAQNNNP